MEESIAVFNASISVTELLAKTLENCARELASRCIKECASRHGFDASEEIRVLGLENMTLVRKQMAKKSVSAKAKSPPKVTKTKKLAFPLPFIVSSVDQSKCAGLAYNRGLFTQCPKEQMSNNSRFCKGCQSECDGSASGIPMCGTVDQRVAIGLYEFKDPKGRSPISYLKVLAKYKIDITQAIEEAGKLSVEIDEEHFTIQEKSDKKTKQNTVARGRPKKLLGAIESEDIVDLFSKLTATDEQEDAIFDDDVLQSNEKKSKKAALSDEEKAIKKATLETDRATKKLEREAILVAEKADREAKRKAELAEKKLERETKIASEKAEREAKRLKEKEDKEARKAFDKVAKEAEKLKNVVPVVPVDPVAVDPVASVTTVTVTRIQINDKQYLKSSTNILYNPETKEEVGIWDAETKTIKNLPADSDEEVGEEEYESEAEN